MQSQHPDTLHQRNVLLLTSPMRPAAAGDTGQLHPLGLAQGDTLPLRQLNIAQIANLSEGSLDRTSLHVIACQGDDHALRTALIQHGAPRELILQLFGIGTRRYSFERARLGVADRRGRPATRSISRSVEHRIWQLWVLFADPQEPARLRQADQWLLIGLEVAQPLRTLWTFIQRWAREPDARIALAGDRARTGLGERARAEQALRHKHRLGTATA